MSVGRPLHRWGGNSEPAAIVFRGTQRSAGMRFCLWDLHGSKSLEPDGGQRQLRNCSFRYYGLPIGANALRSRSGFLGPVERSAGKEHLV